MLIFDSSYVDMESNFRINKVKGITKIFFGIVWPTKKNKIDDGVR